MTTGLSLRGEVSGRLTAIRPVGKSEDGHVLWLCQCVCGNTKEVARNSFKSKMVKSCGCLRSDAQRKRIKRDGVWNEGKSYSVENGERCYKTRHGWAIAVIRHYGNKCQVCGWDKARCDADHIKEKSQGGLHTIKNARVLCPNCHRIRHEWAVLEGLI